MRLRAKDNYDFVCELDKSRVEPDGFCDSFSTDPVKGVR